MPCRRLIPVVLLLAGALHAQVKLEISVSKASFYVGETMPLRLTFTAAIATAFRANADLKDFRDRMDDLDVFVVDPAEGVEDPLLDNRRYGGSLLLQGAPLLSTTPISVEPILNEWIRFRRPGTYRISVVSRRVWPVSQAEPPFDSPRRLVLTSNVLTLQIQPTPPDWAARQLADAVAILDQAAVRGSSTTRLSRRHAGAILRFLNTREAAVELLKRSAEQNARDPLIGAWYWEAPEIDLGVRTSPYIDASGKLIPPP